MNQLLAQANEIAGVVNPFAQWGIGGGLLFLVGRFLSRVEVIFSTRMDNIEHAHRGLAKAVWMLLAEISTAGSFVREEAKRMIERDERREQAEIDEMARKGSRKG